MDTVREGHGRLLETKREEILEVARQCLVEIRAAGYGETQCKTLLERAENYFCQQKEKVGTLESLPLLDGLMPQMWRYKDETLDQIETIKKPVEPPKPKATPADGGKGTTPAPKKFIKNVYRQAAFPSKTLESQEDIDAYVEKMRKYLTMMLKDCDGIKLS